MRWKAITLPKARDDYARVTAYLSGFYPGTPRRFHGEYMKTLQRLKENPRCCSPYPDNPAYRRALVGKYIVLYKIDDEQHEVHIHRILRGSWDIPGVMREAEDSAENES